MTVRPDTDDYDDIELGEITLATNDGASTRAILARPHGDGPFPAVVIGAEGTGLNTFIRHLAATFAHLGYVAIVPDYYRGDGPQHPDDYDDFETLMSYIGALDFARAVHDQCDALDHVRALPEVDASRVASWGYCTGGTLALFVACLRPDLAASVVFFPSQPTFPEHDARRPVDVVDMLWNIGCPILFLIGDQDVVLPPGELGAFRGRLEQWGVDAEVRVYPGAGHAFNAHGSSLYHEAADLQSWDDAIAFLGAQLHPAR
jgi:carboxymethylenebutenolidase